MEKSKLNTKFIIPTLISILWLLYPLYKTLLINAYPFICASDFYRLLLLNLLLFIFLIREYFIHKEKDIMLHLALSFCLFAIATLGGFYYNRCFLIEIANSIPLIYIFILYRNRIFE